MTEPNRIHIPTLLARSLLLVLAMSATWLLATQFLSPGTPRVLAGATIYALGALLAIRWGRRGTVRPD